MQKKRSRFKQIFQILISHGLILMTSMVLPLSNSWAKSDTAITFTDTQKPIVLHRSNQPFKIILKSNPTTGYIWVLDQFDALSVKPIKRTYHTPEMMNAKHQTIVGAPGYEEWMFVLNKSTMTVPRLTKITFCMMRPWTINCDIKKTFTVIYTI
jgi:predicted secreted protein